MFRFKFRRHRSPKTYHVSSPDGTTLTFELEVHVHVYTRYVSVGDGGFQ